MWLLVPSRSNVSHFGRTSSLLGFPSLISRCIFRSLAVWWIFVCATMLSSLSINLSVPCFTETCSSPTLHKSSWRLDFGFYSNSGHLNKKKSVKMFMSVKSVENVKWGSSLSPMGNDPTSPAPHTEIGTELTLRTFSIHFQYFFKVYNRTFSNLLFNSEMYFFYYKFSISFTWICSKFDFSII